MSNSNHKLWKTINNLLPSKLSHSSAPKVIKVVDVKVDNPTDIANHFKEFFCKIGNQYEFCKHPKIKWFDGETQPATSGLSVHCSTN